MAITLPSTPLAAQADLDALAARVAALEHVTPPPPPVVKPSPDGTTTSAVGVTLTDKSLATYALVADTVRPPNRIARNGIVDPVTGNVSRLGVYAGGQCFQWATGGVWVADGNGVWTQTADPTTPPPPPGSIYKVANGQIYDPAGNPWRAQGICLLTGTARNLVRSAACDPLLTQMPKTTGVVLASQAFSTYDVAVYLGYVDQAVQWLTAMGVVVILADYTNTDDSTGAITGGLLATCVAYHAALAARYKDNHRVWFMPGPNEGRPPADASAQHRACYDAIRGAGNTAPIIFYEQNVTSTGDFNGIDNSVGRYNEMEGIVWSLHPYGGWPGVVGGNESNPADCDRSLLNGITATQAATPKSKDGTIPIIFAEFGNAYGNNLPITSGTLFQRVATYGPTIPGCSGWFGWVGYWPGSDANAGDNVFNPNDTTQLVAGYGDVLARAMI